MKKIFRNGHFLIKLRGALKAALVLVSLTIYFFHAIFTILALRDNAKRKKAQMKLMQLYCRLALKIWNVKTVVQNLPKDLDHQTLLIVGNHMGFVDIFILANVIPSLFVTSIEMRDTPVIGLLTRLVACLYVERRNRSSVLNEKSEIVKNLKDGFKVVLYPEGAASNGESVLPFKRTLMMAAADAEIPVQLVCTNFLKINGEPFSLKFRDNVCWYGDMGFFSHMWKLLQLSSIDAEFVFLERLHPNSGADKAALAVKAHGIIERAFKSVKFI